MSRHYPPLVERFWSRVTKTATCWLWNASVNTYGYGQIRDGAHYRTAHRVSWKLHHGAVPAGMCVLHRCDNTRCVRPDHLFIGSQQDNIQDKVSKRRQARGENHGQAKLTKAEVRGVFAARRRGESREAIARRLDVSIYTIIDIDSGRSWASLSEGGGA